jgi:hypothetical protein
MAVLDLHGRRIREKHRVKQEHISHKNAREIVEMHMFHPQLEVEFPNKTNYTHLVM